MPEMTGIHFFKGLRGTGNGLPFIFFSSNLVDPVEIDGKGEADGVHLLTKDSDLEKLKQLVLAFVK
jgi:hypothetical protein